MPIQQMFLGLGSVADVEAGASDNNTNIVLSTVFGSDWAADVPKIYTVASGVDVGGTNTHAIHADSGMGGTLEIVVAGTVTGFGGTGGTGGSPGFGSNTNATAGGNGTNGGTAIRIDSNNVTVTNTGTISGGGGGAGGGGGGGGKQAGWTAKYGSQGGNGGNGAGWNQSQTNGQAGSAGPNPYQNSYKAAGGNGGTLGNDGQQGLVGFNYSDDNGNSWSRGGYRGLHGSAGAAIAGSSYTLSNSGTINGSS